MAAILACGTNAVLSHHTAAALWEIRPHTGDVHVTVTGRQPRNKPGLQIHRSHSLDADVEDGLPLTTPARTLVDLAPHLRQHELDRRRRRGAGYRVVRFTWRQITRESHAVVAMLATLLRDYAE